MRKWYAITSARARRGRFRERAQKQRLHAHDVTQPTRFWLTVQKVGDIQCQKLVSSALTLCYAANVVSWIYTLWNTSRVSRSFLKQKQSQFP